MKSVFAVAYLTACLSAIPASAAEEPILVTASRTETRGATLIGRDAIEALQPATALEVLDRWAGVRAFSKGGAGGGSYLSVRGGEPNFTLVLLDGLKVNDPTNSQGGAFDLAQIDPQALDRIELARGARSAVHGADALAGVVNLRLREVRRDERFASAQAHLDSEGGHGFGGSLGSGWEAGGALLSASRYDSGDLTAGADLSRWQALARGSQALGDHQLTALLLHAETERRGFPEDSGGPRLAAVRDLEARRTEMTAASLGLAGGDGAVRPSLSLNWSRQDTDAATPPIAPSVPAISAATRFERLEALADVRTRPTAALTLAAGVGYLEEDGRSRGTIDLGALVPADFDAGRHIVSAFGEATYEDRSFSASAGVRFDDPSTASSEWTGRAALRLGPAFASYADGYKLPSLYALYYPLIANPALKPERSRSLEAGLEHAIEGGSMRLAYFNSRFRDLIDFDPTRFTNVNRSRVTTQGIEAEASGQLSTAWRLRGALTYLDVASATPLRARPRWQGATTVEWQATDAWLATLGGRFNSAFLDSSVPTGLVDVDGHVEIDAALRYAVAPAVTLQLTARNLLAADYEDAVGFPAPGRVLRLTLSTRL